MTLLSSPLKNYPRKPRKAYFFLEIEIVTTKIVNSKSLKRICPQLLSTMNVLNFDCMDFMLFISEQQLRSMDILRIEQTLFVIIKTERFLNHTLFYSFASFIFHPPCRRVFCKHTALALMLQIQS